MPPRYPAFDPAADPALTDGVWRPWIKTREELENSDWSEEDQENYLRETDAKFNEIMNGERLRITLAEKLIEGTDSKPDNSQYCLSSSFGKLRIFFFQNFDPD